MVPESPIFVKRYQTYPFKELHIMLQPKLMSLTDDITTNVYKNKTSTSILKHFDEPCPNGIIMTSLGQNLRDFKSE